MVESPARELAKSGMYACRYPTTSMQKLHSTKNPTPTLQKGHLMLLHLPSENKSGKRLHSELHFRPKADLLPRTFSAGFLQSVSNIASDFYKYHLRFLLHNIRQLPMLLCTTPMFLQIEHAQKGSGKPNS